MDKASIVVPVFNTAKYLPECINSLINQTYKNIEIILVDDGSTDKSLDICKKYARNDKRVKVYSIKKSGVSTARNIGIEMATGEYITFVDSDDWVETDMVEFAINKQKESGSDIVIWSYFKNYNNNELKLSLIPGGNQIFEENKDILYLKAIYPKYGEKSSIEDVSVGTVMCKLYKKNFLLKNNIKFNPFLIRAEDVVFSLNAFKYAKKISFYDKSLYHYRMNNSSTTFSARFISNTNKPFNLLLKEIEAFIKQQIKDDKKIKEYYNAFFGRTLQVLKWHLEHNYFHEDYPNDLMNRRKEVINLIKTYPYNTALIINGLKTLPKKEKIMRALFRLNGVLLFYFIYKIHAKVQNTNKRNYE